MAMKARGRSISFRPDWLYEAAKAYGASLAPQLTPSEVTCLFLRNGLKAAGWSLPEQAFVPRSDYTQDIQAAIAEVTALGGDPEKILRDALPSLAAPAA